MLRITEGDFLGLPYRKKSDNIVTLEQARDYGINCRAFARLFLAHSSGLFVPEGFQSSDFYDNTLSTPVDLSQELPQKGDVFIFGRKLGNDSRAFHVAVDSGKRTGSGVPILAHATVYEGQSTEWSLDQFPNYHGTQAIKGVRRFNQQ